METIAFLGFIPILIYLGMIIFTIYLAVRILKLMKQRNDYLRDIRDEMKEQKRVKFDSNQEHR